MLKIGDFSRLAGVSVKTLRHYAELRLLLPAWTDRFTGYRYYTVQQLPRLNRILALKELGFSLEQIRPLLAEDLPAAEFRGMLRLKHAELQQQVAAEQARLARVESRLRQIEQEGGRPSHDVVVKPIKGQLVAGIRAVLPTYADIGGLFTELARHLATHDAAPAADCPHIAVYYDREYRERGVEVEAATPVDVPPASATARLESTPTSRVSVHRLPACLLAACTVHAGSYSSLSTAYRDVVGWIEANGYRISGPSREVYMQDDAPGDGTPLHARGMVTELQFPVEIVKPPATGPDKENAQMEPSIINKPTFTVVGARYVGRNQNNEIPQLWDRYGPAINGIKHKGGELFYGVCDMPAGAAEGEFEYIAAVEPEPSATVPEGMVTKNIPAGRYAVFPTTLPTIHDTWGYIMQNWLPRSGYKRAMQPDFELYDETFDPADPNGKLYIYVPIE
jgi:predicted transcriptional regulator YdeE/DNA-binding transcriptional MerR regulator